MQPSFHWINEPAEWHRDADGLTVVTDKHTDFWRHTWYGFERFSGHHYSTQHTLRRYTTQPLGITLVLNKSSLLATDLKANKHIC